MNAPSLVGILNITPDSFSGDGHMGEQALERAVAIVLAGADMLDVGAESTRPNATPLTHAEEWARLAPFLEKFREVDVLKDAVVAVDTRHAETARKALALGVRIINDESGLREDAMCEALAEANCDVVVMHALTLPVDPAVTWGEDVEPVAEILRWKDEITARAASFGIAPERLIYDPGIGFGKTPEQSLVLMQEAATLKASGGRWYYGHSRKSFMKLLSDAEAQDRDALTLAFSVKLAEAGIDFIRVHNVLAHRALFERVCT